MALYRALGDRSGAGLALTVPVYLALAEGHFTRAEQLLDESEELLRSDGSWWHLTATLLGEQERRAARLLGAAEALSERTGSAIAMPL